MGFIFAGGGGGGGGAGRFRASGTNRKVLRRVIGPGLLIVYISVSHSTS